MLNYRDGCLHLQGKSLKLLAEGRETPFFLFNESRLKANYKSLVEGLSRSGLKVTVRYCAKTNHEVAILKILKDLGSGLMVSHLAEAKMALQLGFNPERVAYQRPYLQANELREVLRSGIRFLHAARFEDLEVLEQMASEMGKKINVSLRLRVETLSSRLSPLSFLSRRLGFSASELLSAARRIRASNWLTLTAINFYLGTQQKSPSNYRSLLRQAARLRARIHQETGILIEEINCGGGVPSPSLRRMNWPALWAHDSERREMSSSTTMLQAFCEQLSGEFLRAFRRAGLPGIPSLGIEPGRSLVGDTAVLVTRVCAVNRNWIFLDASHNFLSESPFLFKRRVLPLMDPGDGPKRRYHFSGSTLNSMDIMMFQHRLRPLQAGDVLVLCDAGAYSISRATRYAGLTPAAYLLQEDGQLRTIRRAETLSDLTAPMLRGDAEKKMPGEDDV